MKFLLCCCLGIFTAMAGWAQCPSEVTVDVHSNQGGYYFCSANTPHILTVVPDLPTGATNLQFYCNWYLPGATQPISGGQSHTALTAGLYKVSGSVVYTNGGQTCTSIFTEFNVQLRSGPIKAYVVSDQKDDVYCGNSINLSMELDLPGKVTIPNFSNINWTSNVTSSNGDQAVVNGSGTYEASGTVNILNGCQNVPIVTAKRVILDGVTSAGTNYRPKHYWTFESATASPIALDAGIGNKVIPFTVTNSAKKRRDCGTAASRSYKAHEYDLMSSDIVCGANDVVVASNLGHNSTNNLTNTVGGAVGDAMNANIRLKADIDIDHKKRATREYLVKLGPDYLKAQYTEEVYGNFMYCLFSPGGIKFGGSFYRNGIRVTKNKTIKLSGVGRRSWEYYLDDNWHHIVLTGDLEMGTIKLYVDGITSDELTLQYFPDPLDEFIQVPIPTGKVTPLDPGEFPLRFGSAATYYNELFIDEMAIYDDALSPTMVYKHYINALTQGNHYSFEDDFVYCANSSLFTAPSTDGQFYAKDYPIGYTVPAITSTGTFSSTTGIKTPIEQIQDAPFPRYLPDNTLKRNFPWINYGYLGGDKTYDQANYVTNAAALNEELALHWNYMTHLGGTGYPGIQNFANEHPEIPSCLVTHWPQLQGVNVPKTNLDQVNYSRSIDGSFNLDAYKLLNMVPNWEIVKADGRRVGDKVKNIMTGLQRPLDVINENGEILPYGSGWKEANTIHGFNPKAYNEYQSSGITWSEYQARAKTNYRKTYRDAMIDENSLLKDKTAFTYYSVSGSGGHNMASNISWNEIKQVQKNFGNNHYSTPDVYPFGPAYWNLSAGGTNISTDALHGLRNIEIANGDPLFSPFVCAGWKLDPTRNIRPGQWLGLLKAFGAMGAEFYHGCYFSAVDRDGSGNYIFQEPQHWVWQTLIPGYAQAITSRYEYILRDGELLFDPDLKAPTIGGTFIPSFVSLKGGSGAVYTTARKWVNPNESQDVQYIFSTTNQNYSNTVEPKEKLVTFNKLPDLDNLVINSRRQGSTYLIKKDEINYTEPVFIQLDSWHEPWHPDHWDKDYVFEAEVPDEMVQITTNKTAEEHMGIRSRKIHPTTGAESIPHTNNYDFSSYVTYYTFPSSGSNQNTNWTATSEAPRLSYRFRVKDAGESYRLYVRARAKDNVPTGINVNLMNDGRQDQVYADKLGCINSDQWKWYSFGICGQVDFNQLDAGYHWLDLIPENEYVEIDKIILDADKNRLPGEFLPFAPFVTSCSISPVPSIDFTWDNECAGKVQFTSKVWPLLDPSCNQNLTYSWVFRDPQGVQLTTPVVTNNGTGTLVVPPYVSGTYENPVFDFPGPGGYVVVLNVYMSGTLVATTSKLIPINPNPSVSATVSVAGNNVNMDVCQGQKVTLDAIPGIPGNYSYSWSPTLTILNPTAQSSEATPDDFNGTMGNEYKVMITDNNTGCSSEQQVNPITIKPPLVVTLTSNGASPLCHGTQSVTLNTSVTGGQGGSYSYKWSDNSTNSSLLVQDPNGLKTANYSVTVTDIGTNSLGCVGEANLDVIVDPSAIAVEVNNGTRTVSECYGTSMPQHVINVTTPSTTTGYTFSWKETALNQKGLTTPIVSVTNNGSTATVGSVGVTHENTLYTVTVKDAAGCTGEGYFWLNVKDDIGAEIEGHTKVCALSTITAETLTAKIKPSTGSYTYDWSNTPVGNLNCTSPCTNVNPVMTNQLPAPASGFIDYDFEVKVEEVGTVCYSIAKHTLRVEQGNCSPSRLKTPVTAPIQETRIAATNEGAVTLYPNPNNGIFEVRFEGGLEKETLKVQVLDLQGKAIWSGEKGEQTILPIEMDQLPQGLYFVRIFNENHHLTTPMVIH